jgi:phytoene dehydrogenase-like protein
MLDAVIVGAGPNGLACALELADAGLEVALYERAGRIGGGLRSRTDLFDGCVVDQCASIMAMAGISPFFRKHGYFTREGAEWINHDEVVGHALDDGEMVGQWRNYERTAQQLGEREGRRYRRVIGSLLSDPDYLPVLALGNLRRPFKPSLPALKFAYQGAFPATLWNRLFTNGPKFAALFAGTAAHSVLPLSAAPSAGIGLALLLAGHLHGWPVIRGGSQQLADAMGRALVSKGGRILTGAEIGHIDELPEAKAYVFDLPPRNICRLAKSRLSQTRIKRLQRYRHGFGTWKVDFVTQGPIPWRNPELAKFATVHLGGTAGDVAASEQAVSRGTVSAKPFLILAQTCSVDPGRGSKGRQPGWAYCHVPNGFTAHQTEAIIGVIERHAPGFRSIMSDYRVTTPADFEASNPNYIGGDVVGGQATLGQILGRPLLQCHSSIWPILTSFHEILYHRNHRDAQPGR